MNSRTQHTIVRNDETVRGEYEKLQAHHRELRAQLSRIDGDISQAETNLGAMVAAGCDYVEYTANLADLRLERDALKFGLENLANQTEKMRRIHSWLGWG